MTNEDKWKINALFSHTDFLLIDVGRVRCKIHLLLAVSMEWMHYNRVYFEERTFL
jgi:hypothetical protein